MALNNMKKYINSILAAVCVLVATFVTSCNTTDAEKDEGKTPYIEYVRVCEPTQSDSLLVAAPMGQKIALIGNNLGDVDQIWFNDQKALLNPTLITSNAIIVEIPNVIPTDVNNKMTLITSKGITYAYDFSVIVPNPVIKSISCEYAKAGDKLTIYGDYFLEPHVYFPGNIEAEIVDFAKTYITFKVPENAVEGYLTVKSMYGSTRTTFRYLDTTGLIMNFDDGYANPWGKGVVGSQDGISGSYLWMKATSLGGWSWQDALMYGYWASAATAHGNKPIATGDITKLALKFEANIITWSDVPMLIWFAKYNPDGGISPDDSYAQAHWKPWFKNGEKVEACTNGWVTITIPLTDFKYNKEESANNLTVGDISQYTDLNIMMFGAADGPSDVDIRMDNFRIVSIE